MSNKFDQIVLLNKSIDLSAVSVKAIGATALSYADAYSRSAEAGQGLATVTPRVHSFDGKRLVVRISASEAGVSESFGSDVSGTAAGITIDDGNRDALFALGLYVDTGSLASDNYAMSFYEFMPTSIAPDSNGYAVATRSSDSASGPVYYSDGKGENPEDIVFKRVKMTFDNGAWSFTAETPAELPEFHALELSHEDEISGTVVDGRICSVDPIRGGYIAIDLVKENGTISLHAEEIARATVEELEELSAEIHTLLGEVRMSGTGSEDWMNTQGDVQTQIDQINQKISAAGSDTDAALRGLHLAFDAASQDIMLLDSQGNIIDVANMPAKVGNVESPASVMYTDVDQNVNSKKTFVNGAGMNLASGETLVGFYKVGSGTAEQSHAVISNGTSYRNELGDTLTVSGNQVTAVGADTLSPAADIITSPDLDDFVTTSADGEDKPALQSVGTAATRVEVATLVDDVPAKGTVYAANGQYHVQFPVGGNDYTYIPVDADNDNDETFEDSNQNEPDDEVKEMIRALAVAACRKQYNEELSEYARMQKQAVAAVSSSEKAELDYQGLAITGSQHSASLSSDGLIVDDTVQLDHDGLDIDNNGVLSSNVSANGFTASDETTGAEKSISVSSSSIEVSNALSIDHSGYVAGSSLCCVRIPVSVNNGDTTFGAPICTTGWAASEDIDSGTNAANGIFTIKSNIWSNPDNHTAALFEVIGISETTDASGIACPAPASMHFTCKGAMNAASNPSNDGYKYAAQIDLNIVGSWFGGTSATNGINAGDDVDGYIVINLWSANGPVAA